MKRMGIEAIYRRRNTSKPAPGHKIYPYLLRGVKVERPNQVWACDITYIPMARGFVYLVAVVDGFTRRVLSHWASTTMEAGFCVEALEEALGKFGKPEIFNSDQGSQFTSVMLDRKVAISMDGESAWRDNVFIEHKRPVATVLAARGARVIAVGHGYQHLCLRLCAELVRTNSSRFALNGLRAPRLLSAGGVRTLSRTGPSRRRWRLA